MHSSKTRLDIKTEFISCLHCKTNLPKEVKFCFSCGKEQPKSEPRPEPVKKVLTMKEASELLRISRCQVYRLIKQGNFPFFQVGSHKRFLTEDLLAWASKGGSIK